ncbi:MAG: CDF family Co(II)/Ni(II) efflux transporter DmeF [bacterium]
MHTKSIEYWLHDHTFGQDNPRTGERLTLVVVVVTAITMVVEIAAGVVFGSMALLADGLHMGSHASALTISVLAYYYTRRHAADPRFSFGTGKINSLAAFASAILLVVFALVMAWESVLRIIRPVTIEFNQAILVAILGLIVNGVCLLILSGRNNLHHHGEDNPHSHDKNGHSHHHGNHRHDLHQDHNLWSAYLHVMADALTSVLAIAALLAGKYFGLVRMDPIMGIIGAILITRWSLVLILSSGKILLDIRAPERIGRSIRESIESESDNRITDLHVWAVGPEIYAAEIALVSSDPKPANHYCKMFPDELGIVHATVEVHKCPSCPEN